jgi:hypothetical protein
MVVVAGLLLCEALQPSLDAAPPLGAATLPPPGAAAPGPAGWRESGTLRGFKGDAEQLFFSADGKSLYAIWSSGALKQWDVRTWRELVSLPPDPSDFRRGRETLSLVCDQALSADAKLLARGRVDGTINVWELSSRKLKITLRGAGGPIVSLAFSPDGKRLVAGSFDNTVRLWDVSTTTPKAVFEGTTATSLVFTPDGKKVVGNRASFRILTPKEIQARRTPGLIVVPPRPGPVEMVASAGPRFEFAQTNREGLLVLDGSSLKETPTEEKLGIVSWVSLWPTAREPLLAVRDTLSMTLRDPGTLKDSGATLGSNRTPGTLGVTANGALLAEPSGVGGGVMICLPPQLVHNPAAQANMGAAGKVTLIDTVRKQPVACVEKGTSATRAALSPDGKTLAACIQFDAPPPARGPDSRIVLWRNRASR